MKRKLIRFPAVVISSLLAVTSLQAQDALWQYVQPLAGTAGSTTPAAVKHGEGTEKNANTIPAVGVPFAMTQWTPQTQLTEQKCVPPYFYKDEIITGFRGTHWLSGSCTQDYGSFTVMPVTGSLQTKAAEYGVAYSHEQEVTTPAYYRLNLPDAAVTTEITATARCGIMRFTVQRDDSLYLLISPNSDKEKGFVRVNAQTGEIWGYNPVHRIYQGWGQPAGFNGWFYIKTEKPFAKAGTFSGGQVFSTDSIQNLPSIGAYIGWAVHKGEQICIRIGTSFTGLEAARNNLQTEIPGFTFDRVWKQAQDTWENALSQIAVTTADDKVKRIFYTSMYHAMQHPRLFSDVSGTYPVFAGNYQLKRMKNGSYYDDFSMWDIYRAQLPLLEILQPERVNDFVKSLVDKGTSGGWLPVFPCWNSYTAAMIGDHSTAFIASAWAKGIRNYNVQEAYRLMRKNAFVTAGTSDYKNGMGRRALPSYLKYGYIPVEDSVPEAFHKKEQVSRTLEYAYDDYALSVVAKGLGKSSDYAVLQKRGSNFKNVFDASVGMVRARYADGSWYTPFRPDVREFYITEGTPRQYTFYAPHQVPALATLMGGKAKLEASLDSLFGKGEYWHGNEPGHQIPFMYNYTDAAWKTQQQVRQIMNDEYSDGPGGLSGNDDAGQMSAWYIFAAIGFYPVDPVSDQYMLCSPVFDGVDMRLPGNKHFVVHVNKQTPDARFIADMQWNDKPWRNNYITHEMIQQGGTLNITLSATPVKR